MKKLGSYLKNRDRIKGKLEYSWAKMNENLAKKDKSYQKKRSPYLFLQQQDFHHYKPWQTFIADISNKIQTAEQDLGIYASLIL